MFFLPRDFYSSSIPSILFNGSSRCTRTNMRFAALVALVACAGLAGCGGAVTKSNSAQVDALTPSTTDLSFGDVPIGQPVSSAVSLVNQGAAAVELSQLQVSGGSFALDGEVALPVRVPSGGSVGVSLKFDPSSAGSSDGQLTVASNSSAPSAMVRLHGNGTSSLASLSCTSASMTGTGTEACTATLSSPAPSGGQVVNLSSNNAAVTVPSGVTVPAKTTAAQFTATVQAVTSAQTAGLVASVGKNHQTFSIKLNPVQPALSVSSSSVNFGTVAVGTVVTQSVTLSSTGNAAVTISAGNATGSGFALIGASFPMTLNPGQSASLVLQFNPAAAGTSSGQVVLTSNSSTGSAMAIGLSGTATPVLSAVTCGTASYTGAGSDACTVNLNAAAPAGGTVVSLSSNQAAVTVPSSVMVPAGSTGAGFTAAVSSVSTSEAVALTAALGSAAQTFNIQLHAATPTLSVNTTTIAFGNVNVGQTATQSVTLSSTGTVSVTISSISVVGSLFGASGVTTPFTLNPGQTAKLTTTFSPQIAEPYNYTGVITIASNSSTSPSAVVNMSGAGTAATTLSALSCSTASYTGAGTDACTVTLSGAAPSGGFAVALSSNNSAVTVPASVTMASGATSAAFSATVSAVTTSQSATITAAASGLSRTFAIQLGTAAGALSVNATSVPFGGIVANSTAAQSVTLTATGSSPVTVSAASITGTGFSVSGMTFPATLNPGQKATLNIQFAPLTAGSYTGQLTISSNCAGGNISVGLSGTGYPHQVQLSWAPPGGATDPVVGYNIYRAVGGSSSYQLINTAEDSQSTYSDTVVVHATSYVYYVKSVDASGVESPASNATSVTIP